eukprot:g5459.t1
MSSKKRKFADGSHDAYERYKEKQDRRGVIYLSRIPPYMKHTKVRSLLEVYGEITNMHLAEEDPSLRRRRRKAGGNSKKRYTEGWVEYADKKIAKQVARMLNNHKVGGPKRSYYHHDLWNMKYLKGFKWRLLGEKIAYENRIRDQKLRRELEQARRENNEFVASVEKAKEISKVEQKRLAKAMAKGDVQGIAAIENQRKKAKRQHKQVRPVVSSRKKPKLKSDILGKVFSK